MPASPAPRASRSERRKHETRQRLLDAALGVFVRRGFDAATTAEIAADADLGAGTFYLHFTDKRDLYETLARHAARDMVGRWGERLQRGMPVGECVALGLETAAEFWAENRDRARLLLEGGPSFGSEAHVRLVADVAERIRRDVAPPRRGAADPAPEVMAVVMIGLGIELGRLIVASSPKEARKTVESTIRLARRTLCGPTLVAGD